MYSLTKATLVAMDKYEKGVENGIDPSDENFFLMIASAMFEIGQEYYQNNSMSALQELIEIQSV